MISQINWIRWEQRILGTLAVAGAGTGLALGANNVVSTTPTIATSTFFAVSGLVYVYGLVVGVVTLEDRPGFCKLMLPFWAIQIPAFDFQSVGYHVYSGLKWLVFINSNGVSISWGIGSMIYFSYNLARPFYIGINLLAVIFCLLLIITWQHSER